MARTLAATLGGQLLQTHISWVILTSGDAYKIKKPLRLAFVDYSSLDLRRHFCSEELRLNRRLAPSLYLDVVPITGTPLQPALGGTGPVLDYAVHMRRFPTGALFSEQLAAGELQPADVDALSALLGPFHLQAPRANPSSGFARPAARLRGAMAALEGIGDLATTQERRELHSWILARSGQLTPLWTARAEQGKVRDCHGDLHLGNLVRTERGVIAFDCIEFEPALRWIDVIDDVAFVVMDFLAHGRRDFAFRFLNGWLDHTGEHEGLPALDFAILYRALVRAHVAALRSDVSEARRYLQVALGCLQPSVPHLVITYGLPGSGKTFQSQHLLERAGAIRVRSDVERKRAFGLAALDDSRSRGLNLYHPDTTERTYRIMFKLAAVALSAGYPVILDAAFLKRAERDRAAALARDLGVSLRILACEAPLPVLRERLLARSGDASEADVQVLETLLPGAEPLTHSERALTISAQVPGIGEHYS